MSMIDRFRAFMFRDAPPVKAPPLEKEVAVVTQSGLTSAVAETDQVLTRINQQRYQLVALMRDAEVFQAVDTRRHAIVATPWRLEPQEGQDSEFLTDALKPHMENIIGGVIEALLYGYNVMEAVYKQDEEANRIAIDRIVSKPVKWFLFKRSPKPAWWFKRDDGVEIVLDPAKFYVTVNQATYDNPYGESLLSRLYWPVFFKTESMKNWESYLETFGEPIVIGRVADYNNFIKAMTSQGVRRAIGWQPSNIGPEDISTITGGGAGEFERHIDMMNRVIQKTILGQTLTSEVGDTGSYAAAQVHNQVRADKRNADIRLVTVTVQTVIDNLCAFNNIAEPPKFTMADETGIEMERADRDVKLVSGGIVRLTEQYVADRYDFKPGDFEMAENETPAETQEAGEPKPKPAAFAASKYTPGQELMEEMIGDAMQDSPHPLSLTDLRAAVFAATSPADMEERLASLLNREHPDFPKALEKAVFAAHVLGFVNASDGTA